MHKSHQEEHSKQWGHQKLSYHQTDRFMNRRVELRNDKEITTTLTVPCTVRTAVGGKIWRKILGKTSLMKLVNKCGCIKNFAMFNR